MAAQEHKGCHYRYSGESLPEGRSKRRADLPPTRHNGERVRVTKFLLADWLVVAVRRAIDSREHI